MSLVAIIVFIWTPLLAGMAFGFLVAGLVARAFTGASADERALG